MNLKIPEGPITCVDVANGDPSSRYWIPLLHWRSKNWLRVDWFRQNIMNRLSQWTKNNCVILLCWLQRVRRYNYNAWNFAFKLAYMLNKMFYSLIALENITKKKSDTWKISESRNNLLTNMHINGKISNWFMKNFEYQSETNSVRPIINALCIIQLVAIEIQFLSYP